MEEQKIKLDIGCGRMKRDKHIGVDITQVIDGKGKECVDIVTDICTEKLPWNDSTVDEIACFNTLEHLDDMRFALNEMHRVLKDGCKLHGNVPVCNTDAHWQDPTHKRCFIKKTFEYFTGTADWDSTKPSHPRYADYGFKPWNLVSLSREGDMLLFEMTPRKI